jgi:NADH-quinone oxidoreductase subunit L
VYDGFAGKVVVEGSESLLWKRLDGGVIDGAVNGLGAFWEGFARRSRLAQTGYVRAYALLILGGAVAVLGYLLWS